MNPFALALRQSPQTPPVIVRRNLRPVREEPSLPARGEGSKGEVHSPWSLPQLRAWLRAAQRGEWCLYWDGLLCMDRVQEGKDLRAGAMRPEYPAEEVAGIAWRAKCEGRVYLVQRKVAAGRYHYLAVAAGGPRATSRRVAPRRR